MGHKKKHFNQERKSKKKGNNDRRGKDHGGRRIMKKKDFLSVWAGRNGRDASRAPEGV